MSLAVLILYRHQIWIKSYIYRTFSSILVYCVIHTLNMLWCTQNLNLNSINKCRPLWPYLYLPKGAAIARRPSRSSRRLLRSTRTTPRWSLLRWTARLSPECARPTRSKDTPPSSTSTTSTRRPLATQGEEPWVDNSFVNLQDKLPNVDIFKNQLLEVSSTAYPNRIFFTPYATKKFFFFFILTIRNVVYPPI